MKAALRDELVRALRDALAAAEGAHASATDGITHADAKQESDKDTRAIEHVDDFRVADFSVIHQLFRCVPSQLTTPVTDEIHRPILIFTAAIRHAG